DTSLETALPAASHVALRVGVAGRDRGDLSFTHDEATGRFAAAGEPNVVDHCEVVGVDDHAEPAPEGHLLPVADSPGVVAETVARERPAPIAGFDHTGDRAWLFVVIGRDPFGQAGAEGQRWMPRRETKPSSDVNGSVGVAVRPDVLR